MIVLEIVGGPAVGIKQQISVLQHVGSTDSFWACLMELGGEASNMVVVFLDAASIQ